MIPRQDLAALEAANLSKIPACSGGDAAFVGSMTASFTQDEELPFTNTQDRNEEKGKVVIHAAQVGLTQTAVRANPRLAVKSLYFGANAADENHLAWSSFTGCADCGLIISNQVTAVHRQRALFLGGLDRQKILP